MIYAKLNINNKTQKTLNRGLNNSIPIVHKTATHNKECPREQRFNREGNYQFVGNIDLILEKQCFFGIGWLCLCVNKKLMTLIFVNHLIVIHFELLSLTMLEQTGILMLTWLFLDKFIL